MQIVADCLHYRETEVYLLLPSDFNIQSQGIVGVLTITTLC